MIFQAVHVTLHGKQNESELGQWAIPKLGTLFLDELAALPAVGSRALKQSEEFAIVAKALPYLC